MEEVKATECKGSLFKACLTSFKDHPREAGETYGQHLCFALKIASRLIFSGLALMIHGFLPFLFVHTASKTIRNCHGVLDERACKTGGGTKNDANP